jgi:hypothetical protein
MLRVFVVLVVVLVMVGPVWGQDDDEVVESAVPACTLEDLEAAAPIFEEAIAKHGDIEAELRDSISLGDRAVSAARAAGYYDLWITDISKGIPNCDTLVVWEDFMDESLARLSIGAFLLSYEVDPDGYLDVSVEGRDWVETLLEIHGVAGDDGS